jgi:hypothetical protein
MTLRQANLTIKSMILISKITNLIVLLTSLMYFSLIISCDSKKQKSIEFQVKYTGTNFEVLSIDKLKMKNLTTTPENIYGDFSCFTTLDSFLICGNSQSESLISIFSLNRDSLVKEIIVRGSDKKQGLSAANITVPPNEKNKIWIYDITLAKLFKVDINKTITDPKYTCDSEIVLSPELKNMVSPQIINDSLIISTTYSNDNFRYFYANKKIVREIGKLPEVLNSEYLADEKDSKFPNNAYIFKSFLIKHPTEDKIAVFYNKTDRAEFYSNDSLKKVTKGPDNFDPRMLVLKSKSKYSVEDFEQTKYAFISIAYSDNKIYSLYCGTNDESVSSNKVFVFDWQGNFLTQLILDRKVSKISIDIKKNTLYFYNHIDKGIYSSKLD